MIKEGPWNINKKKEQQKEKNMINTFPSFENSEVYLSIKVEYNIIWLYIY